MLMIGRVAGGAWRRAAVSSHARFCSSSSDEEFMSVMKKGAAAAIGSPAETIAADLASSDVFLYMKGVPDRPQCGFSQQVVSILRVRDVPFKSRNVLDDAAIREAIKKHSDWPTIPQLYVRGEFIGGCDIVTTMHKTGELDEVLAPTKPDDN